MKTYLEIRDYKNGLHTVYVERSRNNPEMIAARVQRFEFFDGDTIELTLNHQGIRRGFDLLIRHKRIDAFLGCIVPKRGEGGKKNLLRDVSKREFKVWIPEGYINEVNNTDPERTVRGLKIIFK